MSSRNVYFVSWSRPVTLNFSAGNILLRIHHFRYSKHLLDQLIRKFIYQVNNNAVIFCYNNYNGRLPEKACAHQCRPSMISNKIITTNIDRKQYQIQEQQKQKHLCNFLRLLAYMPKTSTICSAVLIELPTSDLWRTETGPQLISR